MISLDTNVLVRVVVCDDPQQASIAVALLREPDLFVSRTVLLETSWVLAHTYGLDRATVHRALSAIVGYRNIAVENRTGVLLALAWFAQGLDFADALHLSAAKKASEFATFDRKMATRARLMVGAGPVRLLMA